MISRESVLAPDIEEHELDVVLDCDEAGNVSSREFLDVPVWATGPAKIEFETTP